MSKRAPKDPPLQSVVEQIYSIEDGPLTVAEHARGFLFDIQVSETTRKRWPKRFKLGGRVPLTALASRLRAQLDAADLPTDKWEVMPRDLDFGYSPEEHGIVEDEDIWIQLIEDSTAPLTSLRISADLLHALNRLLARFTEDQLSDVFRAMTLYYLHRVVEELHEPALSGQASKKGREKGPSVKKERARALRALILVKADECWARHPRLAGQTVNTAKKIADAVNQARASQNLGRKPLAVSTIANQLRVALREDERQ